MTCSDPFLTPIANSSKKCPLRPPLWGGPRPGPKSEKLQLLEASTNPVREEIQLTFDIFIQTTDYLLRSTATTRDDD